MGSEALGKLVDAMLVEFARSFGAGQRQEDPPADVPAMNVRLLPRARPVQARARRAAPDKASFIKHFMSTLVAAGMVVAALGSLYASPAMADVKPSSMPVKGTQIDRQLGERILRHQERFLAIGILVLSKWPERTSPMGR